MTKESWLYRMIGDILRHFNLITLSYEEAILRLLRPPSDNGPFWREEEVIVDQTQRLLRIERKDILVILNRLALEGMIESKTQIHNEGDYRSRLYAVPHKHHRYNHTRNRT